jgi:cell division initiation protein
MKISPINIKKQEFNKSVRGFDKDEVQAYLEKLADEFESLQTENDSLKKELEQANSKLVEFRKIEKSLQETLLKAQESSSRSIESTKKQTGLMIKEAEIKASQVLEKARENANEIRNSVINLREERDLIIAKLRAIINSQANLLEMKVADAGSEEIVVKKPEQQASKIEVDVNGIVNKLL